MTATSTDIRRYARRSHAERLSASHARRARDVAGRWVGSFSARQWLALIDECDARCYLCGQQFPPDALEPEHIVPLSRGGKNAITNIKPACHHCNSAKGGKTEAEYLACLETKEPMTMTATARIQNALLDCMLPKNVKGVVRRYLGTILTTIIETHGNPDRYGEEREALGRLAALSEMLYDDENRLPRAVRAKLLKEDLKAFGLDSEEEAA